MASNSSGIARNRCSDDLVLFRVPRQDVCSRPRASTMDSAATRRAGFKSRRDQSFFRRRMSSVELLDWLRERGLGDADLKKIEEGGFTGESFVMLDKSLMKELGIKFAGQMLLNKLLNGEASCDYDEEEAAVCDEEVVTGSTAPPMATQASHLSTEAPSTVTVNQLTPAANTSSTAMSQQENDDEERVDPTPTATPTRHELCTAQESEDVAREEEISEVPPYCSTGRYEDSSVFSYDHTVYMYRDKVWVDRQLLRVFFMNPEVLAGWRLDTETILEWTDAWQCRDDERIPTFEETTVVDKADVRVKFSETEGCWSMVGMDSEKIDKDNPTMVLNLKGHDKQFQRSLVIHEFGHALGLDHEHQRSDFWDTIKDFIDLTLVPKGQKVRIQKKTDMPEARVVCYDPESIMHYWFDLSWLKNRAYQDRCAVVSDRTLTPSERDCLKGLLMRQSPAMLPKDPSEADLDQLIHAYGGKDQCLLSRPCKLTFDASPSSCKVSSESRNTCSLTETVPEPTNYDKVQDMDSREVTSLQYSNILRKGSHPVTKLNFSEAYKEVATRPPMLSSRSVQVDTPPHAGIGQKRSASLSVAPESQAVVLSVKVHLHTIVTAIWSARSKWRAIGKGLKVSSSDLDAIHNTGGDLDAVLSAWIRTSEACIDQLLDVLWSPEVDEGGLADSILMTRDRGTRRKLGLE